jgi:hypothetical protein
LSANAGGAVTPIAIRRLARFQAFEGQRQAVETSLQIGDHGPRMIGQLETRWAGLRAVK